MSFHLEYLTDHHQRTGGYDTADHAAQALRRLVITGTDEFHGAVVMRGGAIQHGSGELVTVITEEGDELDVSDLVEPVWWREIATATAERLEDHPDRTLDGDEVAAIVRAGGVTTSSQWEGQPPTGFRLGADDQDWLHVQRVRRRLDLAPR